MRSKLLRCFPFVALLVTCSAIAAEPSPPTGRPPPKPERYAKTIAAFNRQEPEKHGIVFIGSSATTRWKSLPEDFPKLPVLNRAFGGSRINDLIFHFDTIVLRHEPKVVVIDIGGNDLNAGRSVEEAFADYVRLIDLVHGKLQKSRVIINSLGISIKRVTQIPQILEMNGRLAAWAEAHEWARYVDRTVYQLGDDRQPKREHYVDDLLHPSREAYVEWMKVLGPVLHEEWAKFRRDPQRFAKNITHFARQEPEKGGIVFVGSSSIGRWKTLKTDFPDLPVLNRGFGGSTANDIIAHLDTVVLRHEPRLLVIYTGGNDINAGLSVDEAFGDLMRMLQLVHRQLPETRIILNSVKFAFSPKRAAKIPLTLEMNRRLAQWAQENDWVRFVDATSYLGDAQGQPIRRYYVDDLVHLSPGGYKEWQAILEPVLREEWGKVRPSSLATELAPSFGEEHLRRWLKRFPDADFDQDGILTAEEAWRYQGEGPQRARARQAEKQRVAAEAEAAGRTVSPESRLAPDFADLRYGPHERNVFDLWLAKSPRPTPLVIFVHGGAWKIGDKRDVHDATVRACLAAGISVASVNYRFTTTAPLPAPYLDAARALQFLRANATRWNLDPKRVAAYGASAGAVTSLWLAFHSDLADPNSDDPVARESTRLTCAGSLNGQPTVDPFVIREWIGESAFQHTTFFAAFGVKSHADLSNPQLQPVIAEMSPLTHLTRDDVPVFQSYTEPDAPLPPNAKRGQGIHHPIFGHKLKEAMGRVDLECSYLHVTDIPGDPELEMVVFFRRQFGIP